MKKSLLVLALLFSLATFSQSPVDKSFPPEELFALGSYYYPEQWDSSQWERDLKKMSEMGIKFTHFAEFAWAMMEPEEGKFDFTLVDALIKQADKYKKKLILLWFGLWKNAESASLLYERMAEAVSVVSGFLSVRRTGRGYAVGMESSGAFTFYHRSGHLCAICL